jgi:hypothetical protein
MVTAFKVLGVDPGLIEKRLGHAISASTGEELGDLRKIHNSIRDGVSKVADWFGDKPRSDDEQMEGDPAPRPAPPKRNPKGAAAVKETTPVEVVVEKAPEAAAPKVEVPKTVETVTEVAGKTEPTASAPVQSFAEAAAAAAATADPAKPRTDADLKHDEIITVQCEVVSVDPMIITAAVGGVKGPQPSVAVNLKGGYEGRAYHIGGGVKDGETLKPLPVWEVGATVNVTLRGKLNTNPKVNKVQVFVDSVEAAGMEV